MANTRQIEQAYRLARERYAEYGVDTEKAMRRLRKIAISLHCWQGDDVGGFENAEGLSGGGIMATGAYPGKARTPDELRADIEKALSLIPGRHRLNLHAMYAETRRKVDRNELEPRHFKGWVQWAKANKLGMDFNGTYFSHPKAADGFTLSSAKESIRRFWVEHGIACRKIGAYMGRELGTPCVTNTWIPDGYKDIPVDRKGPRERLRKSLDEIHAQPMNRKYLLDAVEGKLFGLGSESYVVGSHEFYLGYAVANGTLLCLDMGHFHPTETVVRQDLGRDDIRGRDSAARQSRRAMGQRPRRDPVRRAGGPGPGACPGRLPRPHAYRPGLLRRQHQPHRRLGHRHPLHDQGPAAGDAGAHELSFSGWRPGATSRRVWPRSRS